MIAEVEAKMFTRISLGVLLFAVILGLCGCTDTRVLPPGETYTFTARENLVSVDLLASSLGLQIAEKNHTHITLKNNANTVLLFTHSGSSFFVNGTEIGPIGQIDNVGGTYYVSESLTEQIRSALNSKPVYSHTPPKQLSGTVVIDAGHGGKDPGAISIHGFYEKTVNLAVARKVSMLLKQRGLNVVMTRNSDRFIELEQRAEIANMHRADLFVSIHADSHMDRSIKGYTMYVANDASYGSVRAAKAISKRMTKVSSNGKGIRREDFRVLVKTKMPAVLVEIGYISNHGEASLISNNSFQNRIAEAISDGICDVITQI